MVHEQFTPVWEAHGVEGCAQPLLASSLLKKKYNFKDKPHAKDYASAPGLQFCENWVAIYGPEEKEKESSTFAITRGLRGVVWSVQN